MKFIPSTWIKEDSTRINIIKINSLIAVLVSTFLLFPSILPACIVSCKSSLNVSLGVSGQATLTPAIVLQDPTCDFADFTVDITDPNDISIGNTLTCDHIGLAMTATATQTSTGNSCSTLIAVEDNIDPQINCVDTVLLCNQSVDPTVIGYPSATDNCSVFANADLSYTDEFLDLACFAVVGSDTVTAQINRTWSVQDASGNEKTCVQKVYLKRVTIEDVVFPAHLNGFVNPALDCSQDPLDLSLTGVPTINGLPIDVTGICELVISYDDQIAPICGTTTGAYRILRTWTIIDYCSGDFTLNVQIINLEDTTAPVVSCPENITVGTLQNDCFATVNLPLATATDDCSGLSINPTWSFGTGYGPFLEVPQGVHEVSYAAQDDCGNISTCVINVTVEDNIPPTPNCDSNNAVDISVFGNALVYASSFDNGSHDNCGLDSIAVSRNGIDFASAVTFDCTDIENSPIEVTLRIWDLAGNQNECSVYAIIDDKMAPAIACPSVISISCSQDYNDLALVGQPTVTDNCSIDSIYFNDDVDLNICNHGTVLRTWTTVDANDNSSSCTQSISLEDTTPLSVAWPQNFVTSICDASIDPLTTGEPVFTNDDCESTHMIYSDDFFYDSPSCYRVLRTWTVYEWCTYDPGSGSNEGLWTQIQIIDVEDHEAPTISCAVDTTFSLFTVDCAPTYIYLASPIATDCNPNVEITNDSPYANGNGEDASGYYPPGTHTITYTATDDCGNFTACSRTISVVDGKLPLVICGGGVNVTIGENGTIDISSSLIDYGSSDNCTATELLDISVSPNTFTCDDVGAQTVTLTVIDEAGNSAFCTTTVNVQNNSAVCSSTSVTVSGGITNENGQGVLLVDMILSGDVQDTLMCDDFGNYMFPEVPVDGSYEVTPYKNTDPLNGVTTFDLVIIKRHILNIQAITSPYKMIAADANKSGSITTFDLVRLRRLILQMDTVFIGNDSWRFVSETFVFPDPTNPFLSTFPESLVIDNLQENLGNLDFIGIKIGDVNGNADATKFGSNEGDARSSDVLKLETENVSYEKDDLIEVPIYAENFGNVLGYQMTFDFDAGQMEYQSLEEGILKMDENHFNLTHSASGQIATSWTRGLAEAIDKDEPLFILTFKAKENGRLADHFSIASSLLRAEAYSTDLEVMEIKINFFESESTKKEQFMLYQNYPNPFNEQTTIPFDLDKTGKVFIQILDTKGSLIKKIEKNYEAGHHTIKLNRKDFGSPGHYFLIMTLSNGAYQTISISVN